jgi:hypothetical protein
MEREVNPVCDQPAGDTKITDRIKKEFLNENKNLISAFI